MRLMLSKKARTGFVCLHCRLRLTSPSLAIQTTFPYILGQPWTTAQSFATTAAARIRQKPGCLKSTKSRQLRILGIDDRVAEYKKGHDRPNLPREDLKSPGKDGFEAAFLGPIGLQDTQVATSALPSVESTPRFADFEAQFLSLPKPTLAADTDRAQQNTEGAEEVPLAEGHVKPDNWGISEPHGIVHRPLVSGVRKTSYKGRDGKRLVVKQEDLSIKMLGERGQTIVLREIYAAQTKNQLVMEPKRLEAQQASPLSSLASILSERERTLEPSEDDFLVNIAELRPDRSVTNMPVNDWNKLLRILVEGFTNSQLYLYIYRHLQGVTGQLTSGLPWVVEQNKWTPDNDQVLAGENALRGHVAAAMSPKEKLVVRLMRECWGLAREDTAEQEGCLSVRLKHTHFKLLLAGNQKWLRRITRLYAGKIELVVSENLVRVLGSKTRAEIILNEINVVLSRTKTEEFVPSLITDDPIDPVILENVGHETNSVVRFKNGHGKISVTWLHLAEVGEETVKSAVVRLLLDACGPKRRHHERLAFFPSAIMSRRDNAGYFYSSDTQNSDKMGWQHRGSKWARWMAPITRKIEPAEDFEQPTKLLRWGPLPWNHPASRIGRTEDLSFGVPNWSPAVLTSTTATFGHVLHRQPRASESVECGPFASDRDRTFVPLIPPLDKLNLPSREMVSEPLGAPYVVLRFVPSADQTHGAKNLGARAPILEVRLEVKKGTAMILVVDVRVIVETHQSDLLCPHHPVDVRVTETRFHHLPGWVVKSESFKSRYASLAEYLDQADMRPWDGVLRAADALKGINIPARFIANRTHEVPSSWSEEQGGLQAQSPNAADLTCKLYRSWDAIYDLYRHAKAACINLGCPAPDATPLYLSQMNLDRSAEIPVDYTLAGAEVCRSAAADFQGFTLWYISIEASGQSPARRAELVLDAVPARPLLGLDMLPARPDVRPWDPIRDGRDAYWNCVLQWVTPHPATKESRWISREVYGDKVCVSSKRMRMGKRMNS